MDPDLDPKRWFLCLVLVKLLVWTVQFVFKINQLLGYLKEKRPVDTNIKCG